MKKLSKSFPTRNELLVAYLYETRVQVQIMRHNNRADDTDRLKKSSTIAPGAPRYEHTGNHIFSFWTNDHELKLHSTAINRKIWLPSQIRNFELLPRISRLFENIRGTRKWMRFTEGTREQRFLLSSWNDTLHITPIRNYCVCLPDNSYITSLMGRCFW